MLRALYGILAVLILSTSLNVYFDRQKPIYIGFDDKGTMTQVMPSGQVKLCKLHTSDDKKVVWYDCLTIPAK